MDDVPACRHAEGTISSSCVLDVWRMASEDSEEFVSGSSPIHRLRDLYDLRETLSGQVAIVGHQFHAGSELLKVEALCRAERIPAEERNDRLHELRPL